MFLFFLHGFLEFINFRYNKNKARKKFSLFSFSFSFGYLFTPLSLEQARTLLARSDLGLLSCTSKEKESVMDNYQMQHLAITIVFHLLTSCMGKVIHITVQSGLPDWGGKWLIGMLKKSHISHIVSK